MSERGDSMLEQLRSSWDSNADLWIRAVRTASIPSREAGTDQAILQAIQDERPGSIIDVGCGEGCLVRKLKGSLGAEVVGVDGSAQLIRAARQADPAGQYFVRSYDRLSELSIGACKQFNVAICNFSLLDDQLAAHIAAIRQLLSGDGKIIIQTLHPCSATAGSPYRDGWRYESFSAVGEAGWQPMPWYFRTLGSWMTDIQSTGMRVIRTVEPVSNDAARLLSIIFVCQSE